MNRDPKETFAAVWRDRPGVPPAPRPPAKTQRIMGTERREGGLARPPGLRSETPCSGRNAAFSPATPPHDRDRCGAQPARPHGKAHAVPKGPHHVIEPRGQQTDTAAGGQLSGPRPSTSLEALLAACAFRVGGRPALAVYPSSKRLSTLRSRSIGGGLAGPAL